MLSPKAGHLESPGFCWKGDVAAEVRQFEKQSTHCLSEDCSIVPSQFTKHRAFAHALLECSPAAVHLGAALHPLISVPSSERHVQLRQANRYPCHPLYWGSSQSQCLSQFAVIKVNLCPRPTWPCIHVNSVGPFYALHTATFSALSIILVPSVVNKYCVQMTMSSYWFLS